jgi:hypothetical protein
MADIFVSYTSSDRNWAFWIGRELEALGHVPHVDDWEIKGSDDTYGWMEHSRPCALRDLGRLSEGTVLGRWNATLRCGGRPRSDRASFCW